MKRDMELVRQLLFEIELMEPDQCYTSEPSEKLEAKGYSEVQIRYHLLLMYEAGLVDGIDASNFRTPENIMVTRMTWQGHEFLDAARDETLWRKALSLMRSQGGGTAFQVLKMLLMEFAKQQVFPSP